MKERAQEFESFNVNFVHSFSYPLHPSLFCDIVNRRYFYRNYVNSKSGRAVGIYSFFFKLSLGFSSVSLIFVSMYERMKYFREKKVPFVGRYNMEKTPGQIEAHHKTNGTNILHSDFLR